MRLRLIENPDFKEDTSWAIRPEIVTARAARLRAELTRDAFLYGGFDVAMVRRFDSGWSDIPDWYSVVTGQQWDLSA